MAFWPKPQLTRNDIVFRVLLQREANRERITFKNLEKALPVNLRRSVEEDWRSFIRIEDLSFYTAFEKAVRKQIPGIYYSVVAVEYLYALPFHAALAGLLNVSPLPSSIDLARVLSLAEFLAEELRIERRRIFRTATERSG